jgi:hypothetical protein
MDKKTAIIIIVISLITSVACYFIGDYPDYIMKYEQDFLSEQEESILLQE